MRCYRFSFLLCTLSLLFAVRPATAGNSVVAGQFDLPEDVDAWSVATTGGEAAAISFDVAPDESACYGSGSALLVTSSAGDRDVEYSVCAVDVVGGDPYAVGLEVYFPDGPSQGWLFWGVTWYDGPGCTGEILNSLWLGPAGYVPDWQPLELWITTVPETRSARVQLWVSSLKAHDTLRLNIDHVFVRPQAELFADDFELGELCRWNVQP